MKRDKKYEYSDNPGVIGVFIIKVFASKYDNMIVESRESGTMDKDELRNQIISEYNDLIAKRGSLPAFEKMLTVSKDKLLEDLEK